MKKPNEILFFANIKWASRVIAALIFFVLIRYWHTVFLLKDALFQENMAFGWRIFYGFLGTSFFALNSIAAFGLYFLKKWSYTLACLSIAVSTLLLGVPYVPGIHIVISTPIIPIYLRACLTILLLTLPNLCIIIYLYKLRQLITNNACKEFNPERKDLYRYTA